MNTNQGINWPPIILGILILIFLVWVASFSAHPGRIILAGLAVLAFASFAKNNF